MPNEKLKKLYDVVGKDYNLPDYNTFEKGLQDTSKRRKFYDLVGQKYNLPEYDKFNEALFEEAVVAPQEEIPTIELDEQGNAIPVVEPTMVGQGALKPKKPNTGGFNLSVPQPTLNKKMQDIFIKHALQLPESVKYDAKNSQVYINQFAKKLNLSPREMRKVYSDAIGNEAKLKHLKDYYYQHPDDTDNLYKIAELHNSLGQHDLALEAYSALEGKLKKLGEKEVSDPNNPNKRPDYVEQRQLPAVAGMAYTQELLGNKAEAQRLKAISESRGYKGQEFSSVGAGEPLQSGNEMTYDEQGRMIPVGSPTPESEYLNGIAQAIENFTLFGPAHKMTEHGVDKVAKNLEGAFDPFGMPSEKIKGTLGVLTGTVETLMGVAGMATPAGALFAMPLVQAQNIAPKESEWLMPIGKVLREYYRQQGEQMPEAMENVTVLADLALLGYLTHQGMEGAKSLKAEYDFKKVFDKLPPEAIEKLAKVGEKRIADAGGDPKVYGEQMAVRLEELKPQVEEVKILAETPEVEPYNPPPHPESLRTVEEGTSIVMNGEEGVLERGDDGTWFHITDSKLTQIKVADKFNPTETLKELGIEVLTELTPEQVARATADAEQVGRVSVDGKEYFVSLDRVGNENPTGDFVLEVKPDGTMINRFDSHPDPTFAKERKLKVINEFLDSKGLPKRKSLTEVGKTEAKAVEVADPLPKTEVEPVMGQDVPPFEAPKIEPLVEAPLKDVESTAKALKGKNPEVLITLFDELNSPRGDAFNKQQAKDVIEMEITLLPEDISFAKDSVRKKQLSDRLEYLSKEENKQKEISDLFDELQKDDRNIVKNSNKSVSEAYHKAKADGSNPKLVEAVELLLAKEEPLSPPIAEKPITQEPVSSEVEVVKPPRIESPEETRVRELQEEVRNLGYDVGMEMERAALAEFSPDMFAIENLPLIKPESAAKETGGKVGTRSDINSSLTNSKKGVSVERAGEILEQRAAEDNMHPHLDSQDWRNIVIDILHAGSKKNYIEYNSVFGKERVRAIKQAMGEKKAELMEAMKNLESADWEKLGFESKKEFKQAVKDIKAGIPENEASAVERVLKMDDAAVDAMLKELDENFPITEEEINTFYEKHGIEEGTPSSEVSSPKPTEAEVPKGEGTSKASAEGELVAEAKPEPTTEPNIKPEPTEPIKITNKEKALKAVDDLESFLLNLPGVKDTTGAERSGAPFKMEDAVKFFADTLRESIEQGYKLKDAIERAIGKVGEHKVFNEMFNSISKEDLRKNASKRYEDQGISLDKPIEQQFGASHASVAEVRKSMGLTDEIDITDQHRRDAKTVMNEGKQIAESTNVQILADEIYNGEKIPNAQEQAALVYEQTKLYNESLEYQDRIDSFTAKGDLNSADQATIELANIRARMKNVMDALDVAGTKMGLAFRMRQLINKRDYSLVALEKRWTSASGGKEVTPSVRKQLEARVRELEAEVKKSEALFKAKEKELADRALLDIQEAMAREKTTPLQRIKAEKKIRKEELAKKYRGVFNDATNIAKAILEKDFYEYSKLVLEEVAGDIKEFAKKLIGDLGKNVEPYVQEIYDRASKKEYDKAFVDEKKGIQIDKQLIRDIVEEGVKDSQDLVDKVFEAVKDDLPESTRREVQDAIAEYGKQINPKLDPLQQEINNLKRDLKLESGLEDAQGGLGVKRSGRTQPKPTPKQRSLKRRINEFLKDYPQDQAELDKKWATALDKTKTALNNSITDLTKRLDDLKNGVASARTPRERIKLDSQAQSLKDMRDDLVKQIEAIEGKKKLSYEQRVVLAIEAAERTAQKYRNRTQEIKKTGTYTKDTPVELSSPKLDVARAKRDADKAAFEQASKDANLDVIAATSKALRDSQNRVAELERKVKAHDLSYAQRAVRLALDTPELKASKKAEQELRRIIDTMREEQGVAEQHRMDLWKKRADNRLKELERRVREKDYGKKVPKETPLDMEMERTAMKIDRAKFDLDVAVEMERYRNIHGWDKVREMTTDIFNFPKSIMASFDISAPFRQGAILFARHPIMGIKASKEMFKHLWSEKEANDWHDKLRLSDGYIRAKKSDLFISEPMARLVAAEERFMSHIAEKIPVIGKGVKASNRAYTGFLNKLRTDVFNQHYEALINEGFSGKELQSELKQMAHLINNFSGRGKLGKTGELASPLLNAAFFAPRYVTSRINTLANAVTGYSLEGRVWGSQKLSARTRIEAYKALGAYVTTGVAILQMAKAAGLEVSDDPRSSDFGKIKDGDLRFDIWAGFQQEIVLFARIFAQAKVDTFNGKVKNFNEGFGSATTGSTFANFIRSKASPQVGYAWSAMTGQTMGYEEFDAGKELLRMSVPLLLQDPVAQLIYSDAVSMYNEGDAGLGSLAASATGIGVQYQPPPQAVMDANLNEKSLNLMKAKQYKPQDHKDDEVYVDDKLYDIDKETMSSIKKFRAEYAGKKINDKYSYLKQLTPEAYEKKVNSYYNEGLKKARKKYLPSGWTDTKPKEE